MYAYEFRGLLVVIAPGSNLQIVIGIMLALMFIRVYTTYRPFLDNNISVLKDLIQWQLFFVFFIAFLLKTESFPNHESSLHVLLVLAVFASLIVDIFNVIMWLCFQSGESDGSSTASSRNAGVVEFELRPSDFSRSQIISDVASRDSESGIAVSEK
jgi:hypothetical protein